MTTEDNFETLFQTYTRDKIDEIVGGIREVATTNTESIKSFRTQVDENSKKMATLQAESAENKEGIRGLQNRLSESQSQASNLVQATKTDLEKKNSDLAARVEKLESAPPPKAGIDFPDRFYWEKKLYTFQTYDYVVTVYHVAGYVYYVFVNIEKSVFRSSPPNTPSSASILLSDEIAALKLYFTPQKLYSEAGKDAPFIISTYPGASNFVIDELGQVGARSGRVGFFAVSAIDNNFPITRVDEL